VQQHFEASHRGPRLHLVVNDALPEASFHLVQARIEWSNAATSEGWGRDRSLEVAQLKAVAEAVERAGYARLPRSAFLARASDLESHIEPARLLGYAADQYDRPGFPFHRFAPSQERWWLPATAVLEDGSSAVVADCACNPRAFDQGYRRSLLTYASTSGCASGIRVEDAVERATLELIERDAFMRHWFAQAPGLSMQVDTLPAAVIARIQRLMDAGCDVGVQCLDRGMHPVWLVWAQHAELHFTSLGAASGLDAETSLEHAMNELEPIALARAAGVPRMEIRPEEVRSPANHAALFATPGYFRRADRLLKSTNSMSFADALRAFSLPPRNLYRRLQRRGHPAYWVDLTVADAAGLPNSPDLRSVRVFAPGLVPLAFGYGMQPLGLVDAIAAGGDALHPFA